MPRYAAVDIGSNSLRLLVAEASPGVPLQTVAVDRQVTRLGESVFRTGRIGGEAMQLACDVLERMARTYLKLDVLGVRAVATSAVRDAGNQAEFLARASQAIGAPVEIISGAEEARLIHLGVQARWPHPDKRIVVLDVGGGSAEVILSENGRLAGSVSKPLGAVRLKELFLKSDPPTPQELRRMDEYIEEKLSAAVGRIGRDKVDRTIATSATASAVVCAINGIPREERDTADRLRAGAAQVRRLYERLAATGLAGRRKIAGIGPRRAEIIVPGAALLHRALQDFGFPSLYYSAAGVRDGIVADLLARGVGKELSMLSREQRRVVEELAAHYGVARAHARKVAEIARVLFHEMIDTHRLAPEFGKLLEAAGYLHDAGHYVSDTGHHRHSFYLIAHSDLPGFTERERSLIAHLCRYHRKSLPGAAHSGFQSLPAGDRQSLLRLIPLLRLADALDRSHRQVVERLECRSAGGDLVVRLKARSDPGLEIWAAERLGGLFHETYSRRLVLAKE